MFALLKIIGDRISRGIPQAAEEQVSRRAGTRRRRGGEGRARAARDETRQEVRCGAGGWKTGVVVQWSAGWGAGRGATVSPCRESDTSLEDSRRLPAFGACISSCVSRETRSSRSCDIFVTPPRAWRKRDVWTW